MRAVALVGLVIAVGCTGTSTGPKDATGGGGGGGGSGGGGGQDYTDPGQGTGPGQHCWQGMLITAPSQAPCDSPGECRVLQGVASGCCPPGGCASPAAWACTCGSDHRLASCEPVYDFEAASCPGTRSNDGGDGGMGGAFPELSAGASGEAGAGGNR